MTTSFSVTRDDLIKASLRAVGVLGSTQTPSTEDYTIATQAMNIMLKQWMTKGALLWKINEITVPMVDGVSLYPIGPQAAYVYSIAVTAGGSGYDGTSTITLSAPGTFSGYTNTTATATLTIVAGAITGVTVVNAGTGYQGVPTVTLGGAGSGATLTPTIVGLTIAKPLKIRDEGNFRRNSSDSDISLRMLGRNEYLMYGSKTSSGPVNSFFYDPDISSGRLYVYPETDNSTDELHLVAHMPFEDITSATDTPDFPQEWYGPIKWGLARELVIEYGVDETTERRIESRFRETFADGLGFSVEEASTFFTFDSMGR